MSHLGYANQLNESEISDVDEYSKSKDQIEKASQFANEITTKAFSSGCPDILLYKDGYPGSYEYSSSVSTTRKETKARKPIILDKTFEPVYEIAKLDFKSSALNFDKLEGILKRYQEYPEKYRTLIWRYLLSLPLNRVDFETFIKRDPHPAFTELYKRFDIKSQRMYNKLVRVCSALAYWCPLLAEVSYLPELVYPFVQFIKNDDLVLFEVLICFIMQY